MKLRTLVFLMTLILTAALVPADLPAQTPTPGMSTFDAPDAGTTPGSGFGTFPESINAAGSVTGRYIDSHNVSHGFLRTPAGDEFTAFDVPGAGTTAGSGQGTYPKSINQAGAITGHYTDSNNINHGFLRGPSGDKIITFDAPGAGKTQGSGQGTFPESINDAGVITGRYIDSHNVNHGFLRSASGDKLVTFDAPTAGKTAGTGQGTYPHGISNTAAITGHYLDSNNVSHGLLRP
jgi:hypothetical protein